MYVLCWTILHCWSLSVQFNLTHLFKVSPIETGTLLKQLHYRNAASWDLFLESCFKWVSLFFFSLGFHCKYSVNSYRRCQMFRNINIAKACNSPAVAQRHTEKNQWTVQLKPLGSFKFNKLRICRCYKRSYRQRHFIGEFFMSIAILDFSALMHGARLLTWVLLKPVELLMVRKERSGQSIWVNM